MFLKACSNIERGGRSWALVAVGDVVLVIVLDDWRDTIPLEGVQMLPNRGGNGAETVRKRCGNGAETGRKRGGNGAHSGTGR